MKFPTIAFSLIWLVTSVTFGILAWDSKEQEGTTLARFTTNLQESTVFFSGIDVAKVINGMSTTTNENIASLEESIRHAARLTFWLNLISCIAAAFGFFAQIVDYKKDRRSPDKSDGDAHGDG